MLDDMNFNGYDKSSLWMVLTGIFFIVGLIGCAFIWMITNFDKFAR